MLKFSFLHFLEKYENFPNIIDFIEKFNLKTNDLVEFCHDKKDQKYIYEFIKMNRKRIELKYFNFSKKEAYILFYQKYIEKYQVYEDYSIVELKKFTEDPILFL